MSKNYVLLLWDNSGQLFNFTIGSVICSLALILACKGGSGTQSSLNGLPEFQITEKFGNPDTVLTYVLSEDKIYEYRYNLVNLFPKYKDDRIEIKEMMWNKGSKKTIVWFHQKEGQWISVDNLTYGKDVRF